MPNIYCAQRSEEWFRLRLGRVTSTRMKTVAHGTPAAKGKLLDQMQWEIDCPHEALQKDMEGFGYKTPASIKLGMEREDWLIARYEILKQKQTGKKQKIDRPGLVIHGSIDEFACSPDWLLPDRPGEGKTRVDSLKHEYAIKHGMLPEDKDQVYCQMMCTGYELADYVSYCPDYEDVDHRLHLIEVERDITYSNFLYTELNEFLHHLRIGTRPGVKQAEAGVPNFFDD